MGHILINKTISFLNPSTSAYRIVAFGSEGFTLLSVSIRNSFECPPPPLRFLYSLSPKYAFVFADISHHFIYHSIVV